MPQGYAISGPQLRRDTRPPRVLPGEPPEVVTDDSLDTPARLRQGVERSLPNDPLSFGGFQTPAFNPNAADPRRQQGQPTSPAQPQMGGGADPEDALRQLIVAHVLRTLQQQGQPQQQQVPLPTYQPLDHAHATGFKARLLGALGGFGMGLARTGSLAGAAGAAVRGGMQPDAPRSQFWAANTLQPALQRRAFETQQAELDRKQALDQLTLLSTAQKALHDPGREWTPLPGAENETVFQKSSGNAKTVLGADQKPIRSASAANAANTEAQREKEFSYRQQKDVLDRNSREKIASGRQGALSKYTYKDAQSEIETEDKGTIKSIAESSLQGRMEQIKQSLDPALRQILERHTKTQTRQVINEKGEKELRNFEVAATPAEIAAAQRAQDAAIEKERKKILAETEGTAKAKIGARYSERKRSLSESLKGTNWKQIGQ